MQSIRDEKIVTARAVSDAKLFLLDDVSFLGIITPQCLVDVLETNNRPFVVYDILSLAQELNKIIPKERLTIFSGGGILSYAALRMCGFDQEISGTIFAERSYETGTPKCIIKNIDGSISDIVLDDIIASAKTIGQVNKIGMAACLIASTNISSDNKEYRIKQGSSINNVNRLVAAQLVNGMMQDKRGNQKPAILSLRYLLTKALMDDDYKKFYLSRKFGGPENAELISALIKDVDARPLYELRSDPQGFIRKYR